MSSEWAWTDGDFASSSRLNMASNQRMTGGGIAAIVQTEVEPGVQVFCTETGSGYTEGNLYERNVANDGWDIVGLKGHTHTDDQSGGTLADVSIDNIPLTLEYNKRWAKASDFWQTIVSSGTITDDATNGRINISSGATSGGSATISDGGARKLNFAQPSAFEVTLQVSIATNFQCKLGVRAEDINGGNLTPAKYGIEGCSSSGTVWLLFSSNGTTRSTLTTSANVATGTQNVYRVECDPGTEIRLYVDGILVATKTNDVPSTGTTGFNDLYRAGIKNTAAEIKQLHHYGVMIVGGI